MPKANGYPMAKMQALATRLKKARISCGCTSIDDGARRCKTVSSVYHRHETGVIIPTLPLIERYARGFGVSPCWLAFGVREKAAIDWRAVARSRLREKGNPGIDR